jgi:hypothetical protein
MQDTTETIASLSLLGVSHVSREFPIEITVGLPYRHEEHPWACSISVLGLDARDHPQNIYGEDSLQSLLLALQIVAVHLSSFVDKGGQLLDPKERTPFPLDAYFSELKK